MRIPFAHLTVVLFLAAGLTGCSAERKSMPTAADASLSDGRIIADGAPEGAGGQGFYPLELGNHWTFERRFTAVFLEADGSTTPVYDATTSIEAELVCVEMLNGRSYVVEHDVETYGPDTFEQWVRMRQDASGLYEADVATNTPPSCATRPNRGGGPQRIHEDRDAQIAERLAAVASSPGELSALQSAWDRIRERHEALHGVVGPGVGFLGKAGGPESGEITRLRYSLHTGQSWTIREDPEFTSEDEGGEALHTPAGAISVRRIRVDSEFFGPGDRVVFWFGRHEGFVGLNAHTEGIATDVNGNPIGTFVTDDIINLVGLDLVGPGRF